MGKRTNEAAEVIREALKFLNGLSSFRSRDPEGMIVSYEAPDIVETMFFPCGSSPEHGDGVMLRLEGTHIKVVNPSEDFVDENGNPTQDMGDDAEFLVFLWSVFDPRRVLPNLKAVRLLFSTPQDGSKMCIGKLDLSGLNAPKEFIEYIKKVQGNLDPEVRLLIDKDGRLTQMSIDPILPYETDSLVLEFSY